MHISTPQAQEWPGGPWACVHRALLRCLAAVSAIFRQVHILAGGGNNDIANNDNNNKALAGYKVNT